MNLVNILTLKLMKKKTIMTKKCIFDIYNCQIKNDEEICILAN